jgi:hypothetical protein
MRYLKDKYKCADHWYPSDLTKRVKVDEYLDWHHSNTRFGAAGTFRQKWLFPLIVSQSSSLTPPRVSHTPPPSLHSSNCP